MNFRLPWTGALAIALATQSAAQCVPEWQPGQRYLGRDAQVVASIYADPDGPGPLGEHLIIAGEGDAALSIPSVAYYDELDDRWVPVGAPPDGRVRSMVVMPNGDLVIGGLFDEPGFALDTVRRWDGSSWQVLGGSGTGVDGTVRSLLVMNTGELVAGGNIQSAGGTPMNFITRWDGTVWRAMGSGLDNEVHALEQLANGDLLVGGRFFSAGGTPARCIARWDGSNWSAFGPSFGTVPDSRVQTIEQLASGEVVIGGLLLEPASNQPTRVLRFTGSTWAPMGGVFDDEVQILLEHGSELYVGGQFETVGGVPSGGLARWTGSSWLPFTPLLFASLNAFSAVATIQPLPNGDLTVGGTFNASGSVIYGTTLRWDGSAWQYLGIGWTGSAFCVDVLPDGSPVVGGEFSATQDGIARRIAYRDGSAWRQLGEGLGDSPRDSVLDVLARPDGDVFATGRFRRAGGTIVDRIARWDGVAWRALGSGLFEFPNPNFGLGMALAAAPNGDIYVGGQFASAGGVASRSVARWDGASWHAVGSGLGTSAVHRAATVAVAANSVVYAGGRFANSGPMAYLGRFDGTDWQPVGAGVDGFVRKILIHSSGDVFVAGSFSTAGSTPAEHIARWDGTAWHALGAGLPWPADALIETPNGDVLAAAGGSITAAVQRWNGTSWQPLGDPVAGNVGELRFDDADTLLAAGGFRRVGTFEAASYAELAPTCPATADPLPTPCLGPGGPVELTAARLPWLGGTYRATATGFVPTAVAVSAFDLSPPSVPLSLLPIGLPDCSVVPAPSVTTLILPIGGIATLDAPLVADPTLVGFAFHHQMLQVELDSAPSLVSLSSSNALRLTLGLF